MQTPANRTMKCCGSGNRDSGLLRRRERAKSEVVVKEVYNGVLDFYVDYGFASSIYDDWFWKIFYEKAPKEINSVFGYRTSMSMKNKDTWEFAHKYCGKVWYVCGMVMLPITVIFMLLVIGKMKIVLGV